jgi:hypothetical protein
MTLLKLQRKVENMALSGICIITSAVMFAIGAWSRWWVIGAATPFTPSFISAGLFFWVISTLVK